MHTRTPRPGSRLTRNPQKLRHNETPSRVAGRCQIINWMLNADRLPLRLILFHHAILNVDNAVRVFSNVMLVSYQDDCVSLGLQPV
jgi:hypothetical protein